VKQDSRRRIRIELPELPHPADALEPFVSARTMARDEYCRLLNTLLEAERAGAKLLAAYLDELPADADAWTWLAAIQRDEASNCAVLIHLLLEEGFDISPVLGALPRLRQPHGRRLLQAMYDEHIANISLCEAQLQA
jgi:hypothetical protein